MKVLTGPGYAPALGLRAGGCRFPYQADRRATQPQRRLTMTRFTRFASLTLAALLLVTAAATAKERPHSFRGAGHFTSQTDFVSDGIATHLGKFTEVGSITDIQPGGEPGVFLITAWAIQTAADGDELHEIISGQLNFLTGAGSATITYVGGTGRFENASGSASLQIQLGPDGTFTYRGAGVIDF